MKKIKLNNNIIEFDRIIAYGCSHTEASESYDHIAIGVSESECDAMKLKLGHSEFYSYVQKCNNIEDIRQKNKENSYIKHLSDIFEVEWVNHAVGGTGLDFMSYLLAEHMFGTDNKKKNAIRENDLIIIGVTCPNRLFYFSDYNPGYGTHSNHLQLSVISNWERLGKYFYANSLDSIANEKTLAWKYFHQLKYLSMLSKERKNKIILVPMSLSPKEWMEIKDLELSKMFNNTINKMQCLLPESFESLTLHTLRDTKSRKKSNESELCGYGHVRTEEHIKFAKRLHEELTKDL